MRDTSIAGTSLELLNTATYWKQCRAPSVMAWVCLKYFKRGNNFKRLDNPQRNAKDRLVLAYLRKAFRDYKGIGGNTKCFRLRYSPALTEM